MKRLAATLAILALAPAARANSRLPETNQLVSAPDDPSTLLLRSTFGDLFSHDGGKTWDWLCESAIPEEGQQDPAVALLAGGVVMSAQQVEGLAESPDRGCSWSFTSKTPAIDVARSPDGLTAIAVTSAYAYTDGGVIFNDTQMLETTNAGKDWSPLAGVVDPTLLIDTIDLAPSDPQRIYVTGHVYQAADGTLLVSSDGGQSYVSRPIPFVAGEASAYIAAVDPTNEDLLYARTLGTTGTGTTQQFSRLLVSKDAGQTWTDAWKGDKMLGFALSQDGSRVYVGSALAGLLAANASDLVFSQKSSLQILCLATVGATLYACGNEANSGFILGSSTDEGATFAPVLKLETVHGPIECLAGTAGAECVNEWPALAKELGDDAGSPAPPDAGTTGGCSCESSEPRGFDLAWLGAVALLVVTLRSRLFRAAR